MVGAEERVVARVLGRAGDREQIVVARPLLGLGEDAERQTACLSLSLPWTPVDTIRAHRAGHRRPARRREERPGQRGMAEAVAAAIDGKRHLVVQAGTGTGKSLGLPRARHPQRPQGRRRHRHQGAAGPAGGQGPALPRRAPRRARSSSPCSRAARTTSAASGRARSASGDDQLTLDDLGRRRWARSGTEVVRLVEWGRTSETGDRAELDFEPRPAAWSAVSVSAMECPGAMRCPAGEECFAEAARAAGRGGRRRRRQHPPLRRPPGQRRPRAARARRRRVRRGPRAGGHRRVEPRPRARRGPAPGAGARRPPAHRRARPVADDVDGAGDLFDAALEPGRRPPPARRASPTSWASPLELIGQRVANGIVGAAQGRDRRRRPRPAWLQAAGHLAGDVAFLQAAGDDDVVWVEGPAHTPRPQGGAGRRGRAAGRRSCGATSPRC